MTSNPTIFEKAIAGSSLYDDDIGAGAGKAAPEVYESLAVRDVRGAADVFRPVYDAASGADGFVSIEVQPHLARDTQGTIVEARRLWSACVAAERDGQDPGNGRRPPRHPPVPLRGHQHQHHSPLLGGPPSRGHGRLPFRPGGPGESRTACLRDPLGRQLLRVPRGHQRRQEARRPDRRGQREGEGDPRQDRNRQRAHRVRGLRRSLRRSPLRGSEGERGEPAAAALGLDLDQRPQAAGRLLCRGARRAGLGRHGAARDVRRLSRSWKSPGAHPGRPRGSARSLPDSRRARHLGRPDLSGARGGGCQEVLGLLRQPDEDDRARRSAR